MKLSVTVRPAVPGSYLRRRWIAAAAVALLTSSLFGWYAGGKVRLSALADRAARLVRVARSGEGGTGVTAVAADGRRREVVEGAWVAAGTRLETDARTRARLELGDGTALALDRATLIGVERPHRVTLVHGAVVADVASEEGLTIATPVGEVRAVDARFALTTDDARTSVDVARGDADLTGPHDAARVHAGEEGALTKTGGPVEVTATDDLAQRVAFGDGFDPKTDDDAPPSGLGELRARKPGAKDEIDGAIRLARHDVTARIAGAMARTEVDETFVNTTDQELEGVWRFPLPPDARLERLALEVDGKLVEGEFVDAKRASAIWRGVIQHAAPGAPRLLEEVVWVPGPWRDPALLEWQRGGRAELKIFPIPRKGTRRVVLAYTQHVSPSAGMRRYVYPLAVRGGATQVDEASFDVQILGADPAGGVRARGYDLAERDGESRGPRLSMTRSPFSPAGDLVVEYATADRGSNASASAFAPASSAEDAFVAITLRPALPSRIAERGRDQVLVVDTGRAMFGERLRRAARLAGAIAQQMDRRDRLALLACDIECRAMPGGWRPPGAAAAHEVDAFLAGIEAEGATDLVGAVRAAGSLAGRDADHDLRVVLVSDGGASAGYRTVDRLAAEVTDALPDARAEVIAVPIGSDADGDTLAEIARGGGGVVVPYAPGQSVGAAALDVLATSYGAMLRDVALVLPEGLHDIAPSKLPSIRTGSETLVAARLRGDRASGDVVLRGKLAGEAFEARWPLDVRSTGDEGNAWAARTWASLRVADDERVADAPSRAEAVMLSHRFRVPSRLTSLLVLENEAMFHAFGISRSEQAFEWTGEKEGNASEGVALGGPANKDDDAPSLETLARAKKAPSATPAADMAGATTGDEGPIEGGGGFARSLPIPPRAPPPAPVATASPYAAETSVAQEAPPAARGWAAPVRRGRWMRRVWFRTAAISSDGRPVVDGVRVESARAALSAAPDERQKHADLAKLLVRQGNMEEVEALSTRWTSRDPLDVDAISLRATARVWRGDRDGALRILSGMLASAATTPGSRTDIATSLARAEERAGRSASACALRVAAAEGRTEIELVAPVVACERAQGRTTSEQRWLGTLKDDAARVRVSAAAAKLGSVARAAETPSGDVTVDATWDAGAGTDLDVGVIDPSGRRLAWASSARNVRATDCTSLAHEALGISSGGTGTFVVEIVRSEATTDGRPVAGKVRVSALGRTQTFPFVMTGSRAQVARVDVRMDSRLEAVSDGMAMGSCDPPFFVDEQGVRRMKPGCL